MMNSRLKLSVLPLLLSGMGARLIFFSSSLERKSWPNPFDATLMTSFFSWKQFIDSNFCDPSFDDYNTSDKSVRQSLTTSHLVHAKSFSFL